MEEVCPQSRLPELIDSVDEVDLTRYNESVLSGCATNRYGWEYDMEVGFDVLGLLAKDASGALPVKGEEDLVDGDDAERWAESVNECSSAAVASRESINSPLCESLSSWTPTVHPDR